MDARVVVIGAGIGGLTSAASLAARGADVTVLEKEAWVGGKARRVTVDGAAIDGGPTVFTYREVFDEVFAACGTALEDHVTVNRAEVIARHAWDDSGHLDLYANRDRSIDAVGALLEQSEISGFVFTFAVAFLVIFFLATAGGASIVIEGGQLTVQCPGTLTIKAGKKSMVGPGTLSWPMPQMPASVCVSCLLAARASASAFAKE